MTPKDDGHRSDEMMGEDYDLVPFRDLPMPFKLAMTWHMAIDGCAWSAALEDVDFPVGLNGPDAIAYCKAVLADRMAVFDDLYGDIVFGVAMIGTETMLAAITGDEDAMDDGLDVEDVRARHAVGADHPDYPEHGPDDRWPVLLSDQDFETLRDGWHRFSSYVRGGHVDIPAIFPPKTRHFLAKGMEPPTPTTDRVPQEPTTSTDTRDLWRTGP